MHNTHVYSWFVYYVACAHCLLKSVHLWVSQYGVSIMIQDHVIKLFFLGGMNHKEILTSTAFHAFHGFILIRRHLIRTIKARRLCRQQYSDFQEVISFNGKQLRGSGRHHGYITAAFIKHLCKIEIKHLCILIKRTYKSRKLVYFIKREIEKHVTPLAPHQ